METWRTRHHLKLRQTHHLHHQYFVQPLSKISGIWTVSLGRLWCKRDDLRKTDWRTGGGTVEQGGGVHGVTWRRWDQERVLAAACVCAIKILGWRRSCFLWLSTKTVVGPLHVHGNHLKISRKNGWNELHGSINEEKSEIFALTRVSCVHSVYEWGFSYKILLWIPFRKNWGLNGYGLEKR